MFTALKQTCITFTRRLVVAGLMTPVWAWAEAPVKAAENTLPHNSPEQMLKILVGLIFVVILIFALAWAMRRYMGAGVGGNAGLRALAGVAVGQKERVVLVQVGERQIVVGVAPGQVSMLYAVEKGEEIDVANAPHHGGNPFAEKLKSSLAKLEKK